MERERGAPCAPDGVGREGIGVRGPRRPRRGPGSSLRSAHQPAISEVFLRDYESGSASARVFRGRDGVRVGCQPGGHAGVQRQQSPQLATGGGRCTSAECVHRPRASTHVSGGPAVTVIGMRRGDWAIDPEMLWAASNEGVITARELERLGVPEGTTYRRCRDGGPWQRIGPGIAALHNGTPTWRQHLIAGLLHAGDHAVITGRAALRLHGLRQGPEPDRVHLLIPHAQQVRSWRLFHVERTSRMPRAIERAGLAVAPLVPGRARRGPGSPGRAGDRGVPGRTRPASVGDSAAAARGTRRGVPQGQLDSPSRAAGDRGRRAIGRGVRRAGVVARPAGAAAGALQRARPGRRGRQVGIVDVLVEELRVRLGDRLRPNTTSRRPSRSRPPCGVSALCGPSGCTSSARAPPNDATTRQAPSGTSWMGLPSPRRCPHRGRPSRTTSAASPELPSRAGGFSDVERQHGPHADTPRAPSPAPEPYSSSGVDPSPVSTPPLG